MQRTALQLCSNCLWEKRKDLIKTSKWLALRIIRDCETERGTGSLHLNFGSKPFGQHDQRTVNLGEWERKPQCLRGRWIARQSFALFIFEWRCHQMKTYRVRWDAESSDWFTQSAFELEIWKKKAMSMRSSHLRRPCFHFQPQIHHSIGARCCAIFDRSFLLLITCHVSGHFLFVRGILKCCSFTCLFLECQQNKPNEIVHTCRARQRKYRRLGRTQTVT